MLELRGYSIDEDDIVADPMFLMEIMEINEELAEADSVEKVLAIRTANDVNLKESIMEASQAFKNDDIKLAKHHLAKLKYYSNIEEKTKEAEMSFLEKS